MQKQILLITILLHLSFISCEQHIKTMSIKMTKLYQEKIDYPYSASDIRKNHILENMNKIKKGLTKDQTIELLKLPDELNLTYTAIKSKDKVSGFSLVYILNRNQETGSAVEKDEKLLRVHFNNSEILIWAYSIGIEEFTAIEHK